MNDYIKREDAIAYPLSWDHYDKKNGNRHFIAGVESYREYVEELQSADVVEVVRCADCKWFNPINNGDHGYCGTPFHGAEVYEDDYCSDGEREKE